MNSLIGITKTAEILDITYTSAVGPEGKKIKAKILDLCAKHDVSPYTVSGSVLFDEIAVRKLAITLGIDARKAAREAKKAAKVEKPVSTDTTALNMDVINFMADMNRALKAQIDSALSDLDEQIAKLVQAQQITHRTLSETKDKVSGMERTNANIVSAISSAHTVTRSDIIKVIKEELRVATGEYDSLVADVIAGVTRSMKWEQAHGVNASKNEPCHQAHQ